MFKQAHQGKWQELNARGQNKIEHLLWACFQYPLKSYIHTYMDT